jgi:hypothetical protein
LCCGGAIYCCAKFARAISSDCFLLAPISRLSGFPKCGRATDIVSSSADASRLKKQNFMSDKKSAKKNSEKKFSFFFIEQIVIGMSMLAASATPCNKLSLYKVALSFHDG